MEREHLVVTPADLKTPAAELLVERGSVRRAPAGLALATSHSERLLPLLSAVPAFKPEVDVLRLEREHLVVTPTDLETPAAELLVERASLNPSVWPRLSTTPAVTGPPCSAPWTS